jgi:hypothetical protein
VSEEAQWASFRLNDRGSKPAFPRVPATLLAELTDAAVPVSPDKPAPDRPRALPPIDADADSVEVPAAVSDSQLGEPCEACKACGSLDLPGPAGCDTCSTSSWGSQCHYHPGPEGWFQNTLVFFAGDAWKNNFDDDDNNNFGLRTGLNVGIDLPGQRAVQGQFGLSYGAYDFHGREEILSLDDPIEQQLFATAGVFKRSMVRANDRLAWGAVYDLMVSEEAGERADSLRLAQGRGYVGWALTDRDEIGGWMALRLMNDYAERQRVKVNVTDQANLFWHRTWLSGGDTTAYVGWADEPGETVVGLRARVPLNHRAAIFGNFHYIIPSTRGGDRHPTIGTDDMFTQEAWNVSFGIVFYRGRKAFNSDVSGRFGLPLLPVADNASFSFQGDLL